MKTIRVLALFLVVVAAATDSLFGTDFPAWETTAEQIATVTDQTVRKANQRLDAIASLKEEELRFKLVFVALDDIENLVGLVRDRVDFLKVSHPGEAMRAAAETASATFRDWSFAAYDREDVFQAVQQYQLSEIPAIKAERAGLSAVDRRLVTHFERQFERNGLQLPKATREKLLALRKERGDLKDQHRKNFNAEERVVFTRDELVGVPSDLRSRLQFADGMYHVKTVFSETSLIYKNSPREATRKEALTARYSRAFSKNVFITPRIVRLRAKSADLMGYENWAAYQTEVTMMKNPARVIEFLGDLHHGLDPMFRDDVARLNQLKASDTYDPDAVVQSWDIGHYGSRTLKEEHAVDLSELRQYFRYEKVLAGMLQLAEAVFSLKIAEVEPPYKWHEDVTAIRISDAESQESLGILYLDMFPREGKRDSFSEWQIVTRRDTGADVQLPVAVLLCNFPKKTNDAPVLLELREVETLFHEFGHALHSLLSTSPYTVFSGTNVEPDFVEAPSVMMESFVTDSGVMQLIADEPIPEPLLAKVRASRAYSSRLYDKRQIALAQMDMNIHMTSEASWERFNITSYTDRIMEEVFLPSPEGTSFINTFTHIINSHYHAGYYRYVWASALSADLASVFENSDEGFLDPQIGMKYRREILERGGTRDAMESVEMFLGRAYDKSSYLRRLGLHTD